MDISVILTYRCNSKCSMCYVWQNPTVPQREVTLDALAKLPSGIDNLNLTGGEPTLRLDLADVVDLLYPKAKTLEISSNGLHPERLEPIVRRHPDVKIRFSLEGCADTNSKLRGEMHGYETKLAGLRRLKELGGTDLGFGVTIQDDNAEELVELFHLARDMCVEMATSALHNGFQFHKNDNVPYARVKIARGIERLIVEQLKTQNVKSWFRAYLNLGLIAKVLGHDRLLPCMAGSGFAFVDPFADVYACNVRPDLLIGNLEQQSWSEIVEGDAAARARDLVAQCTQNCWMVGSARPAMRNPRFSRLPRIGPIAWVAANKLRVSVGRPIPFRRYIDYRHPHTDHAAPPRPSFLGATAPKTVHLETGDHYQRFGSFDNR